MVNLFRNTISKHINVNIYNKNHNKTMSTGAPLLTMCLNMATAAEIRNHDDNSFYFQLIGLSGAAQCVVRVSC